MTVTTTWTNPAPAGTLDLAVGDTLTEAWSDGLASDLYFLGGTDGKSGYAGPRGSQLVNGGFEVWQRPGGPFTLGGDSQGADRWSQGISGTDTLSVSKETVNVDIQSFASAKCVFVLGSGAGASYIRQLMHMPENSQLLGQTWTFSVRAKTTTAGAVRIALDNFFGAASHYTYSSFHTGSGNWETLSITSALSPVATYLVPHIYFAASSTVYLDNAMLTPGPSTPEYVPLHPADDLARCQRYYEVLYPDITGAYAGAGGLNIGYGVQFRVQKGGAPTLTKNGTWAVNNCGQPVIGARAGSEPNGFYFYVTSTAAGAVGCNSGAATQSITAEWNP